MKLRQATRKQAKNKLESTGVSSVNKTMSQYFLLQKSPVGQNGNYNLNRNVDYQQFVNGLHEAIGMSKYHWFVN